MKLKILTPHELFHIVVTDYVKY